MLIRLMQHFIDNPSHIDKLICIKGLPEEWLFRPSRFGGKELISPWEPEVEANIPKELRDLCDPVEVTFVYPPIEKGRDYVVDKRIISALRFSFMTEPGQSLWEKIERYLDRMTPRDQKVPKPVLVAPNQKSDFNPHEARRTVRGSLELYKTEVPVVDLRPVAGNVEIQPPILMQTPVVKTEEPKLAIKCDKCEQVFDDARKLRGHRMSHFKKQPAGV